MKIRLDSIQSSDSRRSDRLDDGEVVEHQIRLDINGASRSFRVSLRARVMPDFDASTLYGDPLLEELLRFRPAALATLYRCVGRYRAGTPPKLPLVLVDTDEIPDCPPLNLPLP